MSSAEWPDSWGKEHQAILAFHGICARIESNYVSLIDPQGNEFAQVPVATTWRTLQEVLPWLKTSFSLGYDAGREDLASKVLAPISLALQAARQAPR